MKNQTIKNSNTRKNSALPPYLHEQMTSRIKIFFFTTLEAELLYDTFTIL